MSKILGAFLMLESHLGFKNMILGGGGRKSDFANQFGRKSPVLCFPREFLRTCVIGSLRMSFLIYSVLTLQDDIIGSYLVRRLLLRGFPYGNLEHD